jgi:hypothetical protein
LAGLFTLQSVLIYWLLPHDVRFLGGLHYGLLIVFGAFAIFKVQARLAPARSLIFACAIFLLPWFGIQFVTGQVV